MYHKVGFPVQLPDDRRLNVPTERFRLHVRILSCLGYTGVTVSQGLAALRGDRSGPRRPVCITFDDGFRCVLQNAAPILREYGWAATVFVPSGFIGTGDRWKGVEGYSAEPLLDAEGLRELQSRSWEIGGHTRSHADLSALSEEEAYQEICRGKADLEALLEAPVRVFAYPYGRFAEATPQLVQRAGLDCGVTVQSGVASSRSDPYRLPRVKIASRDGAALFLYRLLLRKLLP